MSKENNLRFNFIESVVRWEAQVNVTHLATKFQLSRRAASTVLQLCRESFPKNLLYNQSNKAFIAIAEFNDQTQLTDFSDYLTAVSTSHQSTKDLKPSVDICVFEVEAPLRNINPLQVRPILRAIREKLERDIGYIFLSSPDYLDRIIQPHALIFYGLRWYVRAYCNKNQQFRDFTLSRFNGEAVFEGKATHSSALDEKWQSMVDVVIEADPRFNDQQKRIIEQDFQMENRQKTITTRAALVNYLLRRLHIDSYKNTPEEKEDKKITLMNVKKRLIRKYLMRQVCYFHHL